MTEFYDRGTDFTENAWDALYSAVDSTAFLENDSKLIYDALFKKLRFISFGDYLKRYIYRHAGMTEPFSEVGLDVYRRIIKDSFTDRDVPPSFEPTTAKLSALSKNWLTQQTVSRKVVFLLGFGLGMTAEDVDSFLTKALREQGINAKDPFETVCWYCYKNGFGFEKYERLMKAFRETKKGSVELGLLFDEGTIGARNAVRSLAGDASLISYLSRLKTDDGLPALSVSARRVFDELFLKAKEKTAAFLNAEEEERNRIETARLEERMLADDRISDAERLLRLEKKKTSVRRYDPEEITEADMERIISSAIPIDRHGNLTPSKASKLNAQFAGKRFSRQHISDVLSGRSEVTRFDIITLNFYIRSQSLDEHPNPKERYFSFIEETNSLLERCFLGELYISNPYECFVLMCLLSEDPLGTYADVWEMSYDE